MSDNRPRGDWNDAPTSTKSYALAGALAGDVDVVADLGGPSQRIRVGAAGNLDVIDAAGNTTTIPLIAAGETISVQAKTIKATSTAQKITVFR